MQQFHTHKIWDWWRRVATPNWDSVFEEARVQEDIAAGRWRRFRPNELVEAGEEGGSPPTGGGGEGYFLEEVPSPFGRCYTLR